MKKLNLLEMANVYGGFDNDKCREVQIKGFELDKEQNNRTTVCNTSEEEKAFQKKLDEKWETWVEEFNKYCV